MSRKLLVGGLSFSCPGLHKGESPDGRAARAENGQKTFVHSFFQKSSLFAGILPLNVPLIGCKISLYAGYWKREAQIRHQTSAGA